MSGKIIAAAIRYEGVTYSRPAPAHHHHVMSFVGEHFPSDRGADIAALGDQGFIDESGYFLDRKSAAERAVELGQIKQSRFGAELFSEYLW